MSKYALAIGALILSSCAKEAASPGPAPALGEKEAPAATDHAADAKQSHDQMFIDMMVPHHEHAVETARIAQERAEHPELKAMADAMITAQQAEIDQMKGWRKAWFGSDETPAMGTQMDHGDTPMDHGEMPKDHGDVPGMNTMEAMKADIERLKTATPFDLAFIDMMIPHHEMAVEMASDSQASSDRAEVKELAAKIIADQNKEIEQMKVWRKEWYPEAP